MINIRKISLFVSDFEKLTQTFFGEIEKGFTRYKMERELKYIGAVHSELKKVEECHLQEYENAPAAEILMFPEYIQNIQNIEAESKIMLFTWLNKAKREILKCRPRNNPENKLIGVFSTRFPDLSNLIGLPSGNSTPYKSK